MPQPVAHAATLTAAPAPNSTLPRSPPAAPATSIPTGPKPPGLPQQQASPNTAAAEDLDGNAVDELSEDEWAALEWAAAEWEWANSTANGTDASASQDGEESSPDWHIVWLVLAVFLGGAAGVGVLVGSCHGAGFCEDSCSDSDCRCSGNGLVCSGGSSDNPLALCLGLLVAVVLVAVAAICFFIGWGVGFVLISALGLLCPLTRECQRRRDDFLEEGERAAARRHAAKEAARAAAARATAAAAATAVQLPSAKVTLSSDAGKPFGGPSSQGIEVGAPLPSPDAARLDALLPEGLDADMV